MSSSRWQKIEELFHAALERKPEERTAFLIEACHDAELRNEVQTLLASSGKEDGFMDRPAMELAAESLSRERPATLTGRRIGHYLIGPLIGAGGMGEVYKARDTNLERDVAVKVLFGASRLDTDGLRRFQREARLLASVSHPNVASVYGFEQVEEVCALVMELVEGETLSDRIEFRRLSPEESLSIAGQIAAAVEAAHARGIIHRDLKPSNIRLSKDGTVKVLDFGLARMLQPQQPTTDGDARNPHSLSTQSISIAGTPQYMSPEQARNDSVDRSTDIWAWGCVLFEMLTGQRGFEGTTWAHTLAKIASEDPDWTRLPAATPASVRSLLEDCLQKDRKRRLGDIAEARRRIENAHARQPTPEPEANISVSPKTARALFILIQCGFLAMYSAALYHVDGMGTVMVPIVTITAMSGIAVRLFLISSVALHHPDAGRKFRRLFPILLLLDAMWAASPLLAAGRIGIGVALAGAAALAYLPFSQRTLIERLYGK